MTEDAEVKEFVRFFEEGWRKAKPDEFIAHFAPRLATNVRLTQPMAPLVVGPAGFERFFRDLFAALPDYEVRVEDWAVSDDTVYLWLTHSATIGRRAAQWTGVDRVRLTEDGLIAEREALFDPTVQLPDLLRAPRLWGRVLRLSWRR